MQRVRPTLADETISLALNPVFFDFKVLDSLGPPDVGIARGDKIAVALRTHRSAAGGLIARVRDKHRWDIYLKFAHSEKVDLAYRIGPEGEDGAFLFFKLAA